MRMQSLFCVSLLAACSFPTGTASGADWMQFGYDAAHTGHNVAETAISLSNVAKLTRLYQVNLAANVDSAPVYRSNVVTPDGTRDLLFALSENGRLMAIDAATGVQVWFKTTTGTQPTASSPAIDPGGNFVYSYGIDGKVHKYQIGDGTEIVTGGWPQIATLKPGVEKGQSGLTIAIAGDHAYLYAVNDGYIGDGGDYQGHITSIDLGSGAQTVFNSLCSDKTIHFVLNGVAGSTDCAAKQSGIWGRGGAVFNDATQRVYVSTGNGPFNANAPTNGFNWADSVLALAPDGTGMGGGLPRDSYTPTNYQQLQNQDADLGSVSLTILQAPVGSTVPHIGMQSGKDSKIRLINLDNMSGAGAPAHVGGELQLINVPQGGTVFAQPAAWVDSAGAAWTFVTTSGGISGLKLCFDATCTATSGVPMLVSKWQKSGSSTSAIVANGVLFHLGACTGGRCVIARDPADGTVLWTSESIGGVHWQSPILVNGKVFVTDDSSRLWAFGASGTPTHVVTPSAGAHGTMTPSTPQTVVDGTTTAFTVAPEAHYAIATVSGCGGNLVGSSYTTGPITSDCTVSATFTAITHIVTPSANTGGTITPSTPQTVNDGDTTSFTIAPASSDITFTVTGCDGTLAGSVYTTAAITSACDVVVTFLADDVIFRNGFE
ncbi:MAG: PQQ-binding-like beta-propeller repeat protein [Dokdonella sp.]|uniref:outer membrane protein assembly factor BamB family protein n=1 Tax=Dokdonella sp. TaxID=2291710 RepID=UPI003267AA9A